MNKKITAIILFLLASVAKCDTTYTGQTYLIQSQSQPHVTINADLDINDKASSGINWVLNKTLTGNYTLTSLEAGKSPWIFAGTLGSGATITTPNKTFTKTIFNNSGQTLTFTTGSGTTATVTNGSKSILASDGTNIFTVSAGASSGTVTSITAGSNLTGGTITTSGTIALDTSTVPLKSNNLSVFAATTSAQLAGVLSDESGTGVVAYTASPTFTGQPIIIGTLNEVARLRYANSTVGGYVAGLDFEGLNASSAYVPYAAIYGGIEANTAGAQSGNLRLCSFSSGSLSCGIYLLGSGQTLIGYTTDQDTSKFQVNGGGFFNGTLSTLHLKGNSSAPSGLAGTGAGTGGTCTLAGTDVSGQVTVATGTSPSSSATVCTVTFANAYAATPHPALTPANSTAVAAPLYADGASTSTFTLSSTTALTASSTYKFNYILAQ